MSALYSSIRDGKRIGNIGSFCHIPPHILFRGNSCPFVLIRAKKKKIVRGMIVMGMGITQSCRLIPLTNIPLTNIPLTNIPLTNIPLTNIPLTNVFTVRSIFWRSNRCGWSNWPGKARKRFTMNDLQYNRCSAQSHSVKVSQTDLVKAAIDIRGPNNHYVHRNPPGFVEVPRLASPLIESLKCQV
jgi:hypothetical protein